MEIATIVLIVLNVIFALCIIAGFLWGLKRGIKKSATRIAFIAGCLLIAFFIAMPITKLIVNTDVSSIVHYEGQNGVECKTLNDIIVDVVISIDESIKEAYDNSESLRALINALPVMIMQSIIFVLAFWILKLLSWIIYAILAKCLWGKRKKSKEEKAKEKQENRTVQNGRVIENGNVQQVSEKKVKKHRLLGACVGTVQGLMIAFFTMIPLAGVASIVGSVDKTAKAVSASENTSEDNTLNLEPLGTLLRGALGDDVVNALTAYDRSALGVMCGWTGIDDVTFDMQSSAKIGGKNTKLRKEVISIANAYDQATKIKSLNLSTLDFDTIQKLFDYLFASNALTSITDELLPYYVNKTVNKSTDMDKDIKAFLTLYLDSYNTPTMGELKNDMSSIITAMKLIQSNDVFALVEGDFNVDSLIDVLQKDGEENPVKDIFTALTGSTTIQKVLQVSVNFMLDKLSEELTNINGSEIAVEHVTFDTINWNAVNDEVPQVINNIMDLYKQYNVEGSTEDKVKNVNFVKIGSTLEVLTSSSLLTKAYDNSIVALNQIDKYTKYVDISKLNSNLDFVDEFTNIQNIIDALIKADALSFITESDISTEEFIKRLGTIVDATKNETCIDVIVHNLTSSVILQASAPRTLNVLYQDYIQPEFNSIFDKINETNINWNNEKQALSNVLHFVSDNATYFLGSINTENIIKNVDVAQLGVSMDAMKTSNLLYPLYKAIVIFAQTDATITEYIDPESITLETNWTQEMANLKLALDKAKESGLVDAMFKANGINDALDLISADETIMQVIVDHLFDSTIIQGNIENIINKLQSLIAEQLNVTISDANINVDDFKANIEQKKIEFSNIINNIAVIASPIMKSDFNLDVFADNLNSFANAFNSLQASAEFKNTYLGILDFLINNETINSVIDFSVVGENFNYTAEFNKIGEIIDVLKLHNAWTPLVDGSATVDEVVNSLDTDTKSQVTELILESKLFTGFAVQALNDMIDEFNGYLNSSVTHIPDGTDLSSQSENIALITKHLLEITDESMTTIDLNNIDLIKMGNLLTALKANKFEFTNGALTGVYDAFVDYMLADVDYGYLIEDACASFGSTMPYKNNQNINWNTTCSAFNDLLNLEDDLQNIETLEVSNITNVINSIGTNENTLVERLAKTYLKHSKSAEQQTIINNFDFGDTTFNTQAINTIYGLKDLNASFDSNLDNALSELQVTLRELDTLNRMKLDNLIAFIDVITNSTYADMVAETNFADEADLIDEFKTLINFKGKITIAILTQSISAFNNSNLILNELANNNQIIFDVKNANNLDALKQSLSDATGYPKDSITDKNVFDALNEIINTNVTASKQNKIKIILNLV